MAEEVALLMIIMMVLKLCRALSDELCATMTFRVNVLNVHSLPVYFIGKCQTTHNDKQTGQEGVKRMYKHCFVIICLLKCVWVLQFIQTKYIDLNQCNVFFTDFCQLT